MTSQQNSRPLLLLVDDERSNLTLLERLFSQHYRVMTASDGQAALDLLVQAPFDLVLLDIMMPGMTGIQVLQAMRGNPNLAEVPVILLSALADTDDVVRGLQLGANDYVGKPINTDVLVARVQTQLALKALQDERKRTITELQAAQEMKDKFFRIAAHDLKSPLANISMASYLLRENYMQDEGAEKMLALIDLCTENMSGVIRDFLDSSALQSGHLDLKIAPVSVSDVVRELENQYRLTALKKEITLDVSEVSGAVCADPARFVQVLENLVSNAIKYSPPGATVSVYAEQHDNAMRVSVRDQGPGIPANERDKLFTQFGKLSTRPTQGESSTGLGLWIVKHLVALQNGRVGVDSEPGQGSTFWVELPLAELESEAAC